MLASVIKLALQQLIFLLPLYTDGSITEFVEGSLFCWQRSKQTPLVVHHCQKAFHFHTLLWESHQDIIPQRY